MTQNEIHDAISHNLTIKRLLKGQETLSAWQTKLESRLAKVEERLPNFDAAEDQTQTQGAINLARSPISQVEKQVNRNGLLLESIAAKIEKIAETLSLLSEKVDRLTIYMQRLEGHEIEEEIPTDDPSASLASLCKDKPLH